MPRFMKPSDVRDDTRVLYRSASEYPRIIELGLLYEYMKNSAGHAGLGDFDKAWAQKELCEKGWAIGHGDQSEFLIALVEDVELNQGGR